MARRASGVRGGRLVPGICAGWIEVNEFRDRSFHQWWPTAAEDGHKCLWCQSIAEAQAGETVRMTGSVIGDALARVTTGPGVELRHWWDDDRDRVYEVDLATDRVREAAD